MNQTTKKKFIIAEDQGADSYTLDAKINELFDHQEVRLVRNINEVSNILLDHEPVRIFWIDINLGLGLEKEGLNMVETIRSRDLDSLIIVFSGYKEYETRARALGANHFFVKGENYNETMENIYNICSNFLKKKGVVSYFGKILHINRETGSITLKCYYNNQILNRLFPLTPIEKAFGENLEVGKIVKISINYSESSMVFVFEKSEIIPRERYDERNQYLGGSETNFLETNIFDKI